uniref:Uncharacterized protein n=1 Tax=Utricularia reniformis TaxID=192314 RepID=A0A1Y0B1J8_9LAMI|nr:hypothetical protein AEK19_MT1106 [Utricularia reniformis]ART31326.1 hypothetical protein AEK19_MT1106 [Utricularia reniformis]
MTQDLRLLTLYLIGTVDETDDAQGTWTLLARLFCLSLIKQESF